MKIYPYKRLNRPVTLRVTSVALKLSDGTRDQLETTAYSTQQQAVALGIAGHTDWISATIGLSATLPPGANAPDAAWSDLSVLAVLTDGETNIRTSAELTRDAPEGRDWSGSLDVLRDDHVARASLAAYAVGTVDGVRGRSIAETDRDWIIDTVSDEPVRGLQLDVQTVSFKRSSREWLQAYADAPWTVDASARVPTVFVNTDVEGVIGLLDGNGSGVESKVRDLLVAQMATDVWTAVFQGAIGDLEVEPGGGPVFPTDWRGEVLREMLPDVIPGVHVEEALRQVHRRRTGDSGWVELQTRIHYAAVRRADASKALAYAIRSLEQMNRESET
ncbi:hypothetical protein [Streptomyces purpurogeneiscleroticus]|uniref:hypothetical protein n=1 Tax=Streptomyces purpurogeneiscleroticus TaxID=68259 RepID=UPI001CBFBA28|nr:hypothetical protein [Streptomyces purpurogeneiscleroticus]MBZ4015903.1 hypothetical protein [Streptomyces purpurogeneiscleroticus]